MPMADLQRHEDRGHSRTSPAGCRWLISSATKIEVTVAFHRQDAAGDLRQDADGDLRQAGRAPDNSGPGCRWLISSAMKIEATQQPAALPRAISGRMPMAISGRLAGRRIIPAQDAAG